MMAVVQKSYAYNADGTMKTDGLRGLTVTYSPVKLPNRIKVSSNTGTVDYIYDANGNKLAVKQGGTMKNVYCGDFVYNTSLSVDLILTPNGQLTRNPSTGAYTAQYNITDHLGNVRSVVNSGSTVLQSTDYYPFGLAFSDANITNNRYLYNGKELEDYTIGTSYLGTLDYGARHYDPRIARWTVPDPMAEKYYDLSSYQYCGNNSISYRDPIGMDWKTNEDRKTAAHLQNKASVLDKRLERREQSLEKKIARIKGNPNNSNNTTNKLEKYENQLSLIQFERSMLCSFSADVTRLGESKTLILLIPLNHLR